MITEAGPTFFPTEADFRRWLEANHETAHELLIGFWKKSTGKASIDWPAGAGPSVELRVDRRGAQIAGGGGLFQMLHAGREHPRLIYPRTASRTASRTSSLKFSRISSRSSRETALASSARRSTASLAASRRCSA